MYGLPILPKKQLLLLSHNNLSKTEYGLGLGQNDLLSVLYALILLSNDKYIATNLMSELYSLFYPYRGDNLFFNGKTIFEIFKLPKDIFNRLSNILQERYNIDFNIKDF